METRAVVIEAYGGKDQLKEATVQLPELKANQLLVKVAATSINPIDWKLREGYLKQMFPWDFPIILGWDVAGDIVEIGADVTEFKVGDAIYARPETTRFGTYADYAIVDAELAAIKPENQNYAEAAAVPLAGLTAYQALFEHGLLKAGEKVLIHAGAGGVGTYAVQLAKQLALTSSRRLVLVTMSYYKNLVPMRSSITTRQILKKSCKTLIWSLIRWGATPRRKVSLS